MVWYHKTTLRPYEIFCSLKCAEFTNAILIHAQNNYERIETLSHGNTAENCIKIESNYGERRMLTI